MKARLFAWLLAGLLPLFAVVPSLAQPLEAHGLDAAYFHVYRGVLFSAANADGGFYPDWVSGLNAGLGGPLFEFYPPLLYLGLDGLHRLGVPPPLGWRLLVALSFELAGRADLALAGAAVFVYSPYFLFDQFERAGPQGLATAAVGTAASGAGALRPAAGPAPRFPGGSLS